MREPRLYRFEFTKTFPDGDQIKAIEQEGVTPCEARRKAFDQLEEDLKTLEVSERQGWRLTSQKIYYKGVLF